ncbi:KAP family P-loop NTPase fold protein [Streptomyces spirodelae]|uniref:AAA family ATPase n=1 Tax=Streptomyces spirodelae TaxID=2812904 RepID=A0ABS3X3U1_9ACTN|nr:P-loop NTPase fold protein [Streptomyces spirodelae]MBO8190050.1 AAA family ATPase [Streptomyces spirodelae]
MAEPNPTPSLFAGDDPILNAEDDLLNRSLLATVLADELQAMNAERGAVVAITGKWGTGKTSLLNLTAEILSNQTNIQVVEFNPWFFSGTDHLIRFFFDEMARQLSSERTRKQRIKDATAAIADKFNKYSASLSPLKFVPGAASIIETAQKTSGEMAQALSTSIHEQRIEISDALSRLEGRIVVLIDDIDRLTRHEVRDLFRLVRLNGSFPNVVYLLCFDRCVVENALGEEGLDGSAYLEKIVKTSIAVPPATEEVLASVLRTGMLQVLNDIPTSDPGDDRFSDVFWQVVRPLFDTIRGVKRFLSSLSLALRSAGDEVALPDLVALEALRVMKPAAHELIAQSVEALTDVHKWQFGSPNQAALAADAEKISAIKSELPDAVGQALISYLFPAAQLHTSNVWHGDDSVQSWRRDNRVAHPAVLRYYLHRELAAGTAPANQVNSIACSTDDEQAFTAALSAIPDEYLEDALDRFLAHVDKVHSDSIPNVAKALLGLLPRFSEEPKGMTDFGRDWTALRPVRKLMQRVEPNNADLVAQTVYSATPSPYARFQFLSIAGLHEGSGDRIISPELEEELRADLRDYLKSAPAESLSSERGLLLTIFHSVDCDGESGNPAIDSATSPTVAARLLETALTSCRSNTLGSVVVNYEDRLAWDPLVAIFGGEGQLMASVEQVKESIADQEVRPRLQRAIAAFELYAAGWRPRDL